MRLRRITGEGALGLSALSILALTVAFDDKARPALPMTLLSKMSRSASGDCGSFPDASWRCIALASRSNR